MKSVLENEKNLNFVPERITKTLDEKFGLNKEPYYEKFNRLYNDHAKKIKKIKMAKMTKIEKIEKDSNPFI